MTSQSVARSSRESFGKTEEELKKADASIEAAELFDDEKSVDDGNVKKRNIEQEQAVLMAQAYDEASLIDDAVDQGKIKDMEKLGAFKNPDALLDKLQEGGENKPEVPAKNPEQVKSVGEVAVAQSQVDAKRAETVLQKLQATSTEAVKAKPRVAVAENVRLQEIDYRAPSLEGSSLNPVDFSEGAIKDVSQGALRYDRDKGLICEGQGIISSEKSQELIPLLQEAEDARSREAFEYVKLSDSAWNAKATKNLSLDDASGFRAALNAKNMANRDAQDKIKMSAVYGAAASFLGGLGIVALEGSAAAAVIGPVSLGGAVLLGGGGGFLVLGGAAWLAKKAYDSYKMKKAEKNFMSAVVAKKVRSGFLSRFGK